MIPEEKLLSIDLSSRVSYDVLVEQTLFPASLADKVQCLKSVQNNNVVTLYWRFDEFVPIHCIKPYLRPMPSMTEEEKDTYDMLVMCNAAWVVVDWLLEHHFDYRGLIKKGLALEAPEGMY